MTGRRRLQDFIAHNNAIPIALGILFLGATSTFAATDPDALYNESHRVVSVDNTYLVGKDLSSYTPRATIVSVTEDSHAYYVAYSLSTIDVQDGVWKDLVRTGEIQVEKTQIGENSTLGDYASRQLKENVDAELKRLRETQEIERRMVSTRVIATEYNGLIGRLLDTTTVIDPPYQPAGDTNSSSGLAQAASAANTSANTLSTESNPLPTATQTSPTNSLPAQSGAMTLQVMGKSDARLPLNTAYVDLGVYVTDPPTNNIYTLTVFLDGVDVTLNGVQIDTSKIGTYHIRYEASDARGAKTGGERTVTIYDPYAPVVTAETASSTATTTP